jgi:DNA-binding response OmpR family regulator
VSRILIVEDDPAILVGLKDNLEFESHQVLTATDGEAGTGRCASMRPTW